MEGFKMKRRIMVVDDAPIVRLIIRNILEKAGYEIVAECVNGVEAVAKYKELKPDLTTLDITMPEMDGVETLKQIKAIDGEAKVIMVTAIDQRDLLLKSIRLGATDYVVKPFEDDRIVSSVQKALHAGGGDKDDMSWDNAIN
jgi:two-component system, chemotaxis family, chemotaxis protein CheY